MCDSPKKSREGNCDDGEHQSVESAKVVRVPAEEIGAEEHPQHVDGIVVRPPGGTNMERKVKRSKLSLEDREREQTCHKQSRMFG